MLKKKKENTNVNQVNCCKRFFKNQMEQQLYAPEPLNKVNLFCSIGTNVDWLILRWKNNKEIFPGWICAPFESNLPCVSSGQIFSKEKTKK